MLDWMLSESRGKIYAWASINLIYGEGRLVKKERSLILAKRRSVWYFMCYTVTLVLSVIRKNYEVDLFVLLCHCFCITCLMLVF